MTVDPASLVASDDLLVEKADFFVDVARALSGCQLVEQELKLYISEALALARKCIGNRVPFKISGEDYADASLERLIETFKKLTDNDHLVRDLKKFKDERNFLSHKGITHCLDYEGDLFQSAARDFQQRLGAIQSEAERIRRAIHAEADRFLAHLWFDDLSKARQPRAAGARTLDG